MYICLCTVLLYSKASNLCYLLTVGWYGVTCKPNLYVYALMMESKYIGLLYNNACKIYRIRQSLS